MQPYSSFRAGVVLALAGAVLIGCTATPSSQRHAAETQPAPLPGDPNALVLGAEVALQRKQFAEAAGAYARAAQLSKDEALAEQATRVAYEHHQWSYVLQSAQHWLTINSTSEEARRFAAFAAVRLYRIDTAAEHVGVLIESAFLNPQAGFLALLPQLSDEGTSAAVTAVLQKLVHKYDQLGEAHYALAQAALTSDNFALALQHAQRAHGLAPYWAPAGLLLARVQLAQGNTEAGLASARKVVEQNGQDNYRLEYALLLIAAGQEEQGRKELTDLAARGDTADAAERTLAFIDYQQGNREAAAQRFSNLLSAGRFQYESLFNLGAIAESREDWKQALEIYARITAGEYAMPAQIRAARIKARTSLQEGVAHLEKFAQTRPLYLLESIAARASLLADNGSQKPALNLLDGAIKQYPDAAELKFARVFLLEKMDRIGDAVAELRRLVQERPGDPTAMNALGYTLVDRTRRHREGYEWIEKALQQTPDNGAVLDSMGWALHRLGKHGEALRYLERAREHLPDPEIELHLGEVLLALGRPQDAREVWEGAAKRYPERRDLQERLQKLR